MFVARSIAADHKDLIHDVSYDFHGRRMATCSSDQSVKVSVHHSLLMLALAVTASRIALPTLLTLSPYILKLLTRFPAVADRRGMRLFEKSSAVSYTRGKLSQFNMLVC